ncbi:Indole-3-acetic acid-induced protein ARG7 [Ananas comosus]|uniref:Indole-3-acetic acid-induced protein ARG7 n=1 Tax=Ananas comosus TaxID=4615 RepID=A0A199VZB8_ANACO|nr:Indole-3-acetic acid-induced protein ARG7 [Ananas comosus]
MSIRVPGTATAKLMLRRAFVGKPADPFSDLPKGHFPICIGEEQKRFMVPISYLKHPLFQKLLDGAEEEVELDHQRGVLRVPCGEDAFVKLTNQLKGQ